jgi:Pilus biogenesis CpaD protein (pilus_cpaD)
MEFGMTRVFKFNLRQIPVLLAMSSALALGGCMMHDGGELNADSNMAYGGSERHPIRVSADGKRAYVKECNDWSENIMNNTDNTFLDSHGCAVQANIAAMIANPKTLKKKPRLNGYSAASLTAPAAGSGGGTAPGGAANATGASGSGGTAAATP